jgi:signal transduction histidine kinase
MVAELFAHCCRPWSARDGARAGGEPVRSAAGLDRTVDRKETFLDVMTTDRSAAPMLVDSLTADAPIISVNPAFTDLPDYLGAPAASRDVTYGTPAEAAMRRLNGRLELQSARIAGMLHDEACQFLASAHLAIADIARDVPPPVQARLQQVRLHLDEVTEQLRRISHELHPGILDVLGPIAAIRSIAQAFTRRTGVRLAVEAQLDDPGPAAGAAVFRFVEEALANIGAHARATSASIAITREGSRLVCGICDDGVGFDVAATLARRGDHSLGLMLIRDRLEAMGGTLHISSTPQQGTCLCAVIPLES